MTIFTHPKAVTNMKDSFRAVVYLKYGFEKPISLHRIKVITIMIIVIIIVIIIIVIIIIVIIIIIMFPETRKYWVDVQRGIVSYHGERHPLQLWLAILLEMVSR